MTETEKQRLRLAASLALLLQLARDIRPGDDEIASQAADWIEQLPHDEPDTPEG